MKNFFKQIGFVMAAVAIGIAGCQKSSGGSNSQTSREPALNAAPLGMEVGYANLAGFRQKLGGQAKFEESVNERTGGVMLKSDGKGLGVEGLSGFSAIFDKNETLVGVVMALPKDANGIYAKLSEKYRPVEKKIDSFMGNGSAKFEKGDSLVIMTAPHLSFAMEVAYVTKSFLDEASKKAEAEAAKKEQEQKSKL